MTLNAYVNFAGKCAEAFHYYEKHLGGRIGMMMTHREAPDQSAVKLELKDAVLHARVSIGDSELFGADIPKAQPMRSAYLSLGVQSDAEAERIFSVLADGGEVFIPMQETFFATRFAQLRDRFGINFELDFYAVPDLTLIVRRSAGLLGVQLEEIAATEIARRSRGTPRIANRLLRRVRDFAQVRGAGEATVDVVHQSLALDGVDKFGLDVACIRIGGFLERPREVRDLATWLSPGDAVRLFTACLTAPAFGFRVVYGASANTRLRWDLSPARELGYEPQDDAERFAGEVEGSGGEPHDRHGGSYTARDIGGWA